MALSVSQPEPRGGDVMTPISSADPAHWQQQQASAEAGAMQAMNFYQARPGEGTEIVSTGPSPQPQAVTGDPAITGCPWDQQ